MDLWHSGEHIYLASERLQVQFQSVTQSPFRTKEGHHGVKCSQIEHENLPDVVALCDKGEAKNSFT